MIYRQRIAQEYNEPFVSVLRGFAQQRESITSTAKTLRIAYNTVKRHAVRYGITFVPQGQQRSTERVGVNKFKLRKPMLYNGIIYLPSDPTSCMLYEKYNSNERRKFINAARRHYE
jgi:hypothetical protein